MAVPDHALAEAQATITAIREANWRLVVASLRGQELAEAAETALTTARRAEVRRAATRRALGRQAAEVAALRELSRLKDEFLSTVSHELRTPLQVVGGYGELLQLRLRATGVDPNTVALADHVVANAAGLALMVEELLDFARLGRDALPVRPEDIDLVPVLQRVIADLRQKPGAERLVVALPTTLPAHADPARVAQAVTNLVANALTYAPEGPIALRARPTRRGVVRVEVADRGPGVPPAERRRVWEKFARGPDALVSAPRGLGIGLAVVKTLVVAQGGRVGLASAPGGGSRFWFELPAAPGGGPPRLER